MTTRSSRRWWIGPDKTTSSWAPLPYRYGCIHLTGHTHTQRRVETIQPQLYVQREQWTLHSLCCKWSDMMDSLVCICSFAQQMYNRFPRLFSWFGSRKLMKENAFSNKSAIAQVIKGLEETFSTQMYRGVVDSFLARKLQHEVEKTLFFQDCTYFPSRLTEFSFFQRL